MNEKKVNEKNEKDLNEMSKNKRVVLFLLEVENKKELNRKEIEKLYIDKYKLNESSNKYRKVVIERNIYYKNSNRDIEKDREIFKKELKEKMNIDYNNLIESYYNLEKRMKKSNRMSKFLE